MPVTGGEVEAILTARDNMSTAVAGATARVAELNTQLQTLGATSGVAFNSVGTAAAGGTEQLSQLDRVATRMVERLLILYAIRGSFNFVVGIFEAAEALTRLNEQTDLSIGKLQEIQYAAQVVGVPFKTATAAVDTLDKKLAEVKISTADALQSIGLSFEKVFALSPDQRFNAIVTAIAAMPNQLQRTAAEVALFGTDSIDPMIKRFIELAREAESSNKIMSDDTVRSLAIADEAYRRFFDGTKAGFAFMLVEAQKIVGVLASPLFGAGFSEWFKVTPEKGFPSPPAFVGPPTPAPGSGGPTMGWDYIRELQAQSSAVKALSADQLAQLKILSDLNALTADHAARLGLTTEQYKQYEKAIKDAAAAQRLHDQELMISYTRQAQLLTQLVAEGVEIRKLSDDRATLSRIQSDLSTAELKVYTEIAKVNDSRARISDLQQQDRDEKKLLDTVVAQLKSELDRAKAVAEFGKIHEQIMLKVLAEEDTLTKALTAQAQLARTAREERMTTQGQRLDSSPTDANITPVDAAARRYAEALQALGIQLKANTINQAAYDELQMQAARAFQSSAAEADKLQFATDKLHPVIDKVATANTSLAMSFHAVAGAARTMSAAISDVDKGLSGLTGYMTASELASQKAGLFINWAGSSQEMSRRHQGSGGGGYASGGPTIEGPSYLHDNEYVVPSGGALIKSGGSGGGITVNLTVNGVVAQDIAAFRAIVSQSVIDAVKQVRRLGSA